MAAQRPSRSLPDPVIRADSSIQPLPALLSNDSNSEAESSEWQDLSPNGPTTAVLTLRGVAQLAPFGALIMVPILTSTLTPSGAGCLCLLFATAGTILPGLCLSELMSGLPWVGTNGGGAICTLARPIIGDIPALMIGWGLIGDLVTRAALIAKASGRILDDQLGDVVSKYITSHGFNTTTYSLSGQATTSILSGPDLLGILFSLLLVCLFAALLAVGLATRLSFFLTCVFVAGFVVIGCTAFFHSSSAIASPTAAPSPHKLILPSPSAILHATSIALAGYAVFDGTVASSAFDGSSEMIRVGLLTPTHVLPVSTFLAVAINAMIYILAVLGLSGGSAAHTKHLPGIAFSSLAAFQDRLWLRGFAGVISVFGLIASFVSTLDTLVHLLSALSIEGLLPRPVQSLPMSVILSTGIVSLLAIVVNDIALLEMAAAGTALSLIAAPTCLLILRYIPSTNLLRLLYTDGGVGDCTSDSSGWGLSNESDTEELFRRKVQLRPTFRACQPLSKLLTDQPHSLFILLVVDGVAIITCAALGSVYTIKDIGKTWPALLIIGIIVLITSFLIGFYQPVTVRRLRTAFSVPMLPVFPLLAFAISVYLAINLPGITWFRMLFFGSVGIVIYVFERLWKHYQAADVYNRM